jgi:ribosomal protein L20
MRVTRGFVAKNRRKRVLKLAKGFRGAHSSQYRVAQQSVLKALSLAYNHRRLKKRNFRSLWIRRINSALVVEGVSAAVGGRFVATPACGQGGFAPRAWSPKATELDSDPANTTGVLDATQGYQTLERSPEIGLPEITKYPLIAPGLGYTNASRLRPISYSLFINSLKKYQTTLNRKVLSQLAIFDPKAFQILVRQVNG